MGRQIFKFIHALLAYFAGLHMVAVFSRRFSSPSDSSISVPLMWVLRYMNLYLSSGEENLLTYILLISFEVSVLCVLSRLFSSGISCVFVPFLLACLGSLHAKRSS